MRSNSFSGSLIRIEEAESEDRFRLGFTYTYRHSDKLYRGRSHVGNLPAVSTTFHRIGVHGAYQLSDELEFELFVPWIHAVREERGLSDIRLSGIGDISLMGKWSPWRSATEHPLLDGFTLLAGLEFPTGADNDQPFVGAAVPSLFQLGNGTFDPMIGLEFQQPVGTRSRVFARALATLPIGESGAGLDPANFLQTSVGGSYRLTEKLHAQLSLDGTFRDRDSLDGREIPNTGSAILAVTSALEWRFNERLAIEGAASFPVYRDVRETQIVPGTLWQIGMSVSF